MGLNIPAGWVSISAPRLALQEISAAGAMGRRNEKRGGGARLLNTTGPTGAACVTYIVQALRTTAAGNWATFNVFFGVSNNGQMTAAVAPVKIAT